MFIAHLSDLHISRFGQRLTDLHHGRGHPAQGSGWIPLAQENGWRIEARKAQGGVRLHDAFRLVDAQNCVHKTVKLRGNSGKRAADQLLRLLDSRQQTSCDSLAENFPTLQQALDWLSRDPDNGNLRFCVLAHVLRTHKPDWVVITGDITDDGEGYDLIRAGFEPFIQKKRLICIPGNHDIYTSPALWTSPAFAKSTDQKRNLWQMFVQSIGLAGPNRMIRDLGEGVLLACLDSCYPSKVPFSPSGEIPQDELDALSSQLHASDPKALRLACLHHPLARKSNQQLGLKKYLPGMRLRNARSIFNFLKEMKFRAVMSGHQHLGYRYQPASGPLSLSAPSSIYGCLSGAMPFYWLLEATCSGIHTIQGITLSQLACAL